MDVLNDPILDKLVEQYLARSPQEQRIQDRLMLKKSRDKNAYRGRHYSKIDLRLAVLLNDINDFTVVEYLFKLTLELKEQGLWKETSEEVLESDLFSFADIKDEELKPKELHRVYTKNSKYIEPSIVEEVEDSGLEWKEDLLSLAQDYPKIATSPVHELICRPPWNIYESIARKIWDGAYFLDNKEIDELFLCSYFYSKSIISRKIFIQIKYEAFHRTPFQKVFRQYPYKKYIKDKKRLEEIINKSLENYFLKNFSSLENIKTYLSKEEIPTNINNIAKTIWPRFFKVMSSLTEKQREALELIYIEKSSYEEAAIQLKISKDSFQDRINGAIKKFKDEFPELIGLKKPKTYIRNKKSDTLYNNLYRKSSAKKVHPLYRIDLKTGEKTEITPRTEKIKITANGFDRSLIKAWAISSTPVPDILETEYFLDLMPESYFWKKGK